MRLAIMESIAPGTSLPERLENIHRAGFEAIELSGTQLSSRMGDVRKALADSPVGVSAITTGYGDTLLNPDKQERQRAMAEIREVLFAAAELGSVGMIMVPIFGPPRLPDLSPYMDPVALERALLAEMVKEMAEYAEDAGVLVLIEPLDHNETHLLLRLEEGIAVCTEAGSPSVVLMADLYHMSVEGEDIPVSLRAAGRWLRHVHLADSNRLLPGLGHTDFVSAFRALREIGYEGDLSLECRYPGGTPDQGALVECGRYLTRCLAEADILPRSGHK